MLARTNAFSGLFARLLQNASIKGGLNSCAKREKGTFSLGKSLVINLSAFASAPSQPMARLDAENLTISSEYSNIFR